MLLDPDLACATCMYCLLPLLSTNLVIWMMHLPLACYDILQMTLLRPEIGNMLGWAPF